MIFLIQYNRRAGQIVSFKIFDDTERSAAENVRLEIELDQNRRGIEEEIVLLEAASEEAVRRTHRRYFEDPGQIVQSASNTDQ